MFNLIITAEKRARIVSLLDTILQAVLYIFIFFSLVSIAGTQISIGLLVVLWIVQMALNRKWEIHRTGLELAFLFFILAAILGTIFSIEPVASFRNLKNILLIVIVYVLFQNIRSTSRLRTLAHTFVFTAAIMSLYGLIMYFTNNAIRVRSTQSVTMTWGAMSVIFFLITTSLFLFGTRGKQKVIYGIAASVQLFSLLLSMVRGSYIGVLLGLFVIFLLKVKKSIVWPAVIIILIGFSVLTIAIYHQYSTASTSKTETQFNDRDETVKNNPLLKLEKRIFSITDLSLHTTQVRLQQWQDAIEMFRDHPIIGFGWIDLGKIHRKYAKPGDDITSDVFTIGHFHSNYIMVLLYFGLVGFLVFLYMLVKIALVEFHILKRIPTEQKYFSALALGLFASFWGFCANGLFDWTFGDAEAVTLFWISIGMALSLGTLFQRSNSSLSDKCELNIDK